MKILDIDHIELYVGDGDKAAQSLCTGPWFPRSMAVAQPGHGLPGQCSVLVSGHRG